MDRMMMRVAVVVTLMAAGCSSGRAGRGVRYANAATLGVSVAALACDWGQTRSAAAGGWRHSHEVNPVMGEKPSTSVVDAYSASVVATNVLVWALMPERWRSAIPGMVIGVQAYVIQSNARTTPRGVCGF